MFRNKEEQVRWVTDNYWHYHLKEASRYAYYIHNVIGLELAWASQNPLTIEGTRVERLRRPDKQVHTLAITVGESLEPLFQMICVLKPQRVVAVLNQQYGETTGKNMGQELRDLVELLPDATGIPEEYRPDMPELIPIVLEDDSPTEVFRALKDALQEPQSQPPAGSVNVVEITGATTKSMVVGAFLYAAQAELPITYVDFDEYNVRRGRPYGHTITIVHIDASSLAQHHWK
jgi:hypothetical protein